MAIDVDLDNYTDANLLGPFTAADKDVEPLCIRMMIYLPASFVGLFIERYLMPAEAWTCLGSAIVDEDRRWIFGRLLVGFASF